MKLPWRLKFGVFMAPYHAVGENPTLAIRRDVRTLQLLDELGFDEAFIGEHHSAGWEPISSPEVFIAHVAQVTRSIRLGSGVLPIPYHNPYMVAERALLLDNLTGGRFMLGVGPGALPSDTAQLGIDTVALRPRLDEGLGVILRLLRGEVVSHESDWFTLRSASCQLQPCRESGVPVFVATTSSPAGARIAGKHGVGVLSGANFRPLGEGLKSTWETAEESAAVHGRTLDRRDWRVMTAVHVAETREQAFADVSENLYAFDKDYLSGSLGRPFAYDGPRDEYAAWLVERGAALIGGPDDVSEALAAMWERSGGFGGLLLRAQDFGPGDKMARGYELFARQVMPRFQGSLDRIARSHGHAVANREAYNRGEARAIAAAIADAGGPVPEIVLGARLSGE